MPQIKPLDLGALLSVRKPVSLQLVFLTGSFLFLLPPSLLGFGFLSVDAWKLAKSGHFAFSDVDIPFLVVMGIPALILFVLGGFLWNEMRKRSSGKTPVLKIFERGVTLEKNGSMETCRFCDIRDIFYRRITVPSKLRPQPEINVIRSIIRQDGQVITLPDSLHSVSVTNAISAARARCASTARTP